MIYVLTKYGKLRFYKYGETDQITPKKGIINTVSSAVAGKSNSYVSPLGTLIENETKKKQHSIKSHLTKGLRIL
jgi:hypothetical protein